MPRFLFVPLFGLLLSACNNAPHAPVNNPLPSAPPVMPASIISVPVTVDLDQVRDQVLKRAPSPLVSGSQTQILRVRFNPTGQSGEPGACSITELNCLARRAAGAVAVDYTVPVETVITHQVYLRDLSMRMTGNQFNLLSQVEFAINTRIKSSLAQFGVASCGVNETMPRIELAMTGTVDWVAAKGDFVVTSKGWSMKWIRPCNITAFQLNVEALLDLPGVREQVKAAMDEALVSGLRQVNLRSALARAWPELNAPREVQPGMWLLPQPKRVAFADPVGNGRYVTSGVLVEAFPIIQSGVKPQVKVMPVPAPERGISGDTFYVALTGDIALEEASRLLNQQMAGKPIVAGTHKVVIEDIRLYGSGDKAVIGLSLAQPLRAEIFVLGRPVFDVEKNEVRFEDMEYSLGTRSFLAKSANWLLGSTFRSALQERARFRFDEDLAETLKDFRDVRQDLGGGLLLRGSLQRVKPRGLFFTQDRLRAYVQAEGRVALDVGRIPAP
ncbi:MAG: DUF4403 family protein [Moraxellaceae bacterium]|nr:DUF4403 family protein [Moraxellaceae bacterium]